MHVEALAKYLIAFTKDTFSKYTFYKDIHIHRHVHIELSPQQQPTNGVVFFS